MGVENTQGQSPPTAIDPTQLYPSETIAQTWRMAVNLRKKWYSVLRRRTRDSRDVFAVGNHFVLSGQTAFETLAELND
ncbi:MAG: hypothetical protein ACYTGL_23745 [Planctomycetota bacterium]|jgi:hypothetical protein